MKLAVAISEFDKVGGAETAAKSLFSEMAKLGHEVHVITRASLGKPDFERNGGLNIHRVGFIDLPFLRTPSQLLSSLRKISEINPDLVQGIMISPGGLIAVLSGKPSSVYARGSDVYNPGLLYKLTLGKFVVSKATAVIALTGDMKTRLLQLCKRKIFVIPNGLELSSFRRSSRLSGKKIVFVGRLEKVKNIPTLLKAAPLMKTKPGLLIVGDGPENENLKLLSRELGVRATFLGEQPHGKINNILASADLLVLPSFSEGFPSVLIEAMASGLPIVASRVGGVSEIVKEGENGFLFDPRSPERLAALCDQLLSGKALARKMAVKNIKKAGKYGWPAAAKALASVYRGMLK